MEKLILRNVLGQTVLHVDYDSFKESSKLNAGVC